MSVQRTYWRCDNLPTGTDAYIDPDDEERRQVSYEEANLVSSLTENGLHAPAIDIDLPATLTGSRLEVLVPADSFCIMPAEEVSYAMYKLSVTGFASRVAALPATNVVRVVMDIGGQSRLVASKTPGHAHLYNDQEFAWALYHDILASLCVLGVVEGGFQWASQLREMSFLRIAPLAGQLALEMSNSL